jgi:hypothetical protein
MLHRPDQRVTSLSQWKRSLVLSVISFAIILIQSQSMLSAGEAPRQFPAAQRIAEAQAFLQEKLSIWQKRLKLEDWNITLRLVSQSALKPKTLGNIHWDAGAKRANINVLSPLEYKMAFPEALQDNENTVLHELIHLRLSSLPRSDASRSAEEKAVNTLTEAFLSLDNDHEQ